MLVICVNVLLEFTECHPRTHQTALRVDNVVYNAGITIHTHAVY